MLRRAERKDPLLRPGFLLVAAGAAEGEVEAVLVDRLLQSLRLPDVGMDGGAVREGVDPPLNGLGIDVNDQLQAELSHPCIAKFVHFSKLPGRVHMEQWERRFRGEERLDRQMQHDRTVFAYGVKHYGLLAFGNRLSH